MDWSSSTPRLVGALLLVASCHRAPAPPVVAAVPEPVPPSNAGVKPSAPPSGKAPTSAVVPKPAPPPRPLISDSAPDLNHEFRGVWVATVQNIDWPSSRHLTTAQQQAELIALLDKAAALKLNAVIFQVRPAADALYASKIEPWSEYLTGEQGQAPDPFWDPLEFAVREAHARGMELHAWFNPYRAKQPGAKVPLAKTHIARTNPSLVKKYKDYLWMDPGEQAVRDRTVRVVLDVVKRYDIDGVHLDDYFYPYPELNKRKQEIPFPDDASFKRYRKSGGKLARDDWRRRNVDLLVEALHDGIHKTKPFVKFGVSPFGIWRPGYPEQIRGFDAYNKLYADARKWLREGWVDYFTPQLYWPTTKTEQSYPALLAWWSNENTLFRHLWPGNFTSRTGGTGSSAWPVSELVEQIRATRAQPGATGNVHFSMKAFLSNQASMNDTLMAGPYADLALIPPTPWLPANKPATPTIQLTERYGGPAVAVTSGDRQPAWQWLVQVRTDTGWINTVVPGSTTVVPLPSANLATRVTVRALNRLGAESPSVTLPVVVQGAGPSAAPKSSNRGRPDVH